MIVNANHWLEVKFPAVKLMKVNVPEVAEPLLEELTFRNTMNTAA